MAETSRKEREFFKSHPVYKNLPPGHFGTDVLINKLTKIYFRVIRENLPRIIKAMDYLFLLNYYCYCYYYLFY